jgi:hypothetical protein
MFFRASTRSRRSFRRSAMRRPPAKGVAGGAVGIEPPGVAVDPEPGWVGAGGVDDRGSDAMSPDRLSDACPQPTNDAATTTARLEAVKRLR